MLLKFKLGKDFRFKNNILIIGYITRKPDLDPQHHSMGQHLNEELTLVPANPGCLSPILIFFFSRIPDRNPTITTKEEEEKTFTFVVAKNFTKSKMI